MDNFDQIPKRRPKSPGWGRLLPFLVIGYILFTSFVGSIRLPSTGSSDPVYSVFFNSSILIGGVVVALILVISYMAYSKKYALLHNSTTKLKPLTNPISSCKEIGPNTMNS